MTTVLDLLKEEGFQEGFQEARLKGFQEAQDKDITRLLQHTSLSPQEIASILEVDLSRVLSLADSNSSVRNGKTPEK